MLHHVVMMDMIAGFLDYLELRMYHNNPPQKKSLVIDDDDEDAEHNEEKPKQNKTQKAIKNLF